MYTPALIPRVLDVMADKEPALLGKPTFVSIDGGRIRCVETGHEMHESAKEKYGDSKKCRAILLDRALSEGRPPLNFFKQSPTSRDKIVCKLTGAIVNKNEDAVWKHVLGRKFNNKLDSEETKKAGSCKVDEGNSSTNQKKKTKDRKAKEKQEQKIEMDVTNEIVIDEEPGFWIPPETKSKNRKPKKHKITNDTNGLTENSDELSSDNIEDIDTEIRLKRLALAVGPSSFASRKKKRKTET